MIDYDAALQKFFDEVIKWLETNKTKTKDKVLLAKIEKEIASVRIIAANPKKYAKYNIRIDANVEPAGKDRAFIPAGQYDSEVFSLYVYILSTLENLYSQSEYSRERAQKTLLEYLRRIKYANSSNPFKYFTFPLMEKFLSVKMQRQK